MTWEGARLQPLDYDGFLLTGTYQGVFLRDFDITAQFSLEAVMASAPGNFPTFIRGDPQDKVIPLHVRIIDDLPPAMSQLNELKRAFSPSRPPGYLRVIDGEGNVRRMLTQPLGLVPWEGHDDYSYVASLHAPEPVWENDTVEGSTGTLSGTAAAGNLFTMTNEGNEQTFPGFRIGAVAAKGQANNWPYHWPVTIAWRSPLEGVDSLGGPYPTDITNAGWYHLAGSAQADCDDVRVFVDGVETDRWLNITGTSTSIWCNIPFQPMRTAVLKVAMTGFTFTESPQDGGIIEVSNGEGTAAFPEEGMLLIDNEAVSYRGKTEAAFLDVRRARNGTTSADHSVGAVIYWVEHDIRFISGYSGTFDPMDDEDRKPMFGLAGSRNTGHNYAFNVAFGLDGMYEADTMRSGQWLRERRGHHLGADLLGMDSREDLGVFITAVEPNASKPNFDSLSLYVPCYLSGTSTQQLKADHNLLYKAFGVDEEGFETVLFEQDPVGAYSMGFPHYGTISSSFAWAPNPSVLYSRLTHHVSPAKLTGEMVHSEDDDPIDEDGLAQTFDLRNEDPILGATFYLQKVAGAAGNIRLSLYAADDTGPIGQALAVASVGMNNLGTSKTKYTWHLNFDSAFNTTGLDERADVRVPPGQYALVWDRFGGTGTVNLFYTQEHSPYGGGAMYDAAGALWAIQPGSVAFFVLSRETLGQPDTQFETGEFVQISNCAVSFNTATTPKVVIGARQSGYLVEGRLLNPATGQILRIKAPLIVGESLLSIDCDAHTVTIRYEDYDHERDALNLVEPGGFDLAGIFQRDIAEWMRLDAGTNYIVYVEDDVDETKVDMERRWRSRWT